MDIEASRDRGGSFELVMLSGDNDALT